jgi:hypothetical protein
MPLQTANSKSSAPLPLFRPEPIAARLRMEGDVLLVRPFSLSLLTVVALFLVIAVSAVLFLIQVPATHSVMVPLAVSSSGRNVTFSVPAEFTTGLAVGDHLSLIVPDSSGASTKLLLTVQKLGPEAQDVHSEQITASLPGPAHLLPSAAVMQLPAGSRPLLKWLLHPEAE